MPKAKDNYDVEFGSRSDITGAVDQIISSLRRQSYLRHGQEMPDDRLLELVHQFVSERL